MESCEYLDYLATSKIFTQNRNVQWEISGDYTNGFKA